ncbi:MAG: SGNH/GDSL hydrolase family protein [Prolixibacteraceae bacterium]|nr:SGNH/GDSL hydrolase family protein [Prolixibacteraceae bacterium]
MSRHELNRRNFIRTAGLTGLFLTGFPELPIQAKPAWFAKRDSLKHGMVLLFQGDSITDGNRGRTPDPNHIMGHGYAFSIASRLGADFPEKALAFYNRGISGNKVTDLAERWQTDALDLQPDVLSILVGVNDVGVFMRTGDRLPLEKFEKTYRDILKQARAKNPDILLVLCQPFILPVGAVKDKFEGYQSAISECQTIVEQLAGEFQAVFVRFQNVMNDACRKAPTEYWMWDGIHPTVAGHELLAREWIKRVGERINLKE